MRQPVKNTVGKKTYMFSKYVCMRAQGLGVCIPDEPDNILHRPGRRVLIWWSFGLLGLGGCIIASWKKKHHDNERGKEKQPYSYLIFLQLRQLHMTAKQITID